MKKRTAFWLVSAALIFCASDGWKRRFSNGGTNVLKNSPPNMPRGKKRSAETVISKQNNKKEPSAEGSFLLNYSSNRGVEK